MKNKIYFFRPYTEEIFGYVKWNRKNLIVYENGKKTFAAPFWHRVKQYIYNKYGDIAFGDWTDE